MYHGLLLELINHPCSGLPYLESTLDLVMEDEYGVDSNAVCQNHRIRSQNGGEIMEWQCNIIAEQLSRLVRKLCPQSILISAYLLL